MMLHIHVHAAPFHFATDWLWTLYAVSLKAVKFIDQRLVMSFITLPVANSVWWARWWITLKFWNLFQPLLKSFTIVCFSDFFYFAFQEYFPWKVKEKWLRKTETGLNMTSANFGGFCLSVFVFFLSSLQIFQKDFYSLTRGLNVCFLTNEIILSSI